MLQLTDLRVEVGGRAVVNAANYILRSGDKAGLTGRNGAGKSSLLKVIAGERTAAAGAVTHKGRMGYVSQDPKAEEGTAGVTALNRILGGRNLDVLASALHLAQVALETDHSESGLHAYGDAEEAFREAGGYGADADARRIVTGLGLRPDRVDQTLGVLSGGERRRVELARALFSAPDVLLLDEPTNHLDKEAKEWLMGFLRGFEGAILVVSHDLELLDSAITHVLHLEHGEVTGYRGSFSQYVEARKRDEERLASTAARQEAEIKRLSLLADVMRRQTAKRAKTAHSLDKRVARLRTRQVTGPRSQKVVRFKLPDPPHSGQMILEARDLSRNYGGPPIFDNLSFDMWRGERLLAMGYNGAGKTSLLRVLAGVTKANAGSFRLGAGVSIGYYAQEHEGIIRGKTVLDHLRDISDEDDGRLRGLIGMFGLPGDMAFQDAATLSGGEKTKLALAMLVAGRHNLLLLDEPTNNLDPASRNAFAAALGAWKGTILLVSHDAEFVEELAPGKVLVMPEGYVDIWDEEFLELVALA